MNEDNLEENSVIGTQERKVEEVRVGKKITETGVLKRTSYEENMTSEGVLERIHTTEFGEFDCQHVGVDIGGQCPCGRTLCRACAEKNGVCFVCGQILCSSCLRETVLDKSKRYHRQCFWESVKRKFR